MMIRTVSIIILSICILGAAGWGAFSYTELQQQQETIQQQDTTIRELQDWVKEVEEEFILKRSQLEAAQYEITSLEAENERMIEAAEQYFYQLEDEVQQLTAENEEYEQYFNQLQGEVEQAQTYEALINLLSLFLGW